MTTPIQKLVNAAKLLMENIFANWRPEMFNNLRDAISAYEQWAASQPNCETLTLLRITEEEALNDNKLVIYSVTDRGYLYRFYRHGSHWRATESGNTVVPDVFYRLARPDEIKPTSSEPMVPLRNIDKRISGIFKKFNVSRVDGTDALGGKHYGCEYFVLDLTHDKHAIPAIAAYADSCKNEYPWLAKDLDSKADELKRGGFAEKIEVY